MDRDPIRAYGDALAVVTVVRSVAVDLVGFVAAARAAAAGPVQVVVADTAGTGTVAEAEVVRLGEDVGRAAAANRAVAGLGDAVGWVALADPGVRFPAGSLDALLDAAARHPRAAAIGPRLSGPGRAALPSAGELPRTRDALRGRIPPRVRPGPVGWLSASCLLVRRAAWDSVDGLDPRYPGTTGPVDVADVDLGDRLGRAGWLLVHVPVVEVPVVPQPGQGILEPPAAGLRRYLCDRGGMPTRALVALAGPRR